MPRPDRGVAQRYAAKKRRRRVTAARGAPVSAVGADRIESAEQSAEVTAPAMARTGPAPRVTTAVSAARMARARPVSRRPFAAYADEYRYVLSDLRRVALVAGMLIAGLIVLSVFLQ